MDAPRTLTDAVQAAASRWPARAAWRFDPVGDVLTFAEIAAREQFTAAWLAQRGVQPGDRVAVMAGNSPAYALAWLACARYGAVLVPLSHRLGPVDLAWQLNQVKPALVLAAGMYRTRVLHAAARAGMPELRCEAPAVPESSRRDAFPPPAERTPVSAMFSSGGSGGPRAAAQDHQYWLHCASTIVAGWPGLTETDTVVTAQPMCYMDVWWQIACGLLSGARVVILDGFHPSSLTYRLRAHQATVFYCMGAMPALMLRQAPGPLDHLPALRAVLCSGIPSGLHAELEERFSVPWYEDYGMTECAAITRVTGSRHDELVGSGCVGWPVHGRRIRVSDAGELEISGPGMMTGYLEGGNIQPLPGRGIDPAWGLEMTAWFPTGDLGSIDEAGAVWLTGRAKDVISRGGEKISAWEVEQVLLAHPRVSQAAVVAVPDPVYGEAAMAYVATGQTPATLAAWTAARLAGYKVPRWWMTVPSLPMTDSHRVAKDRLPELPGEITDAAGGLRLPDPAAAAGNPAGR